MIEMKIDMFTYSEWAGNYIYVSPNNNVYGLYSFDNGMKTLIIDEDMSFNHYQDVVNERAELKEMSDVMVYWLYSESNFNTEEFRQTIRYIVAEYEENPKEFFKKYNVKGRNQMRIDVVKGKKELRTVSNAEFITAWNDMEKYWAENDGDMDENSYYNKIINQPINIELPLLGIKTELFWCPPTVECFDDMFKRMIEDEYVDLLVKEEKCYYTGGGIWIAEVPFEYDGESLVMVAENIYSNEYAVYRNILKDNGKYDSVEYEELMKYTGNANEIEPDFQIYYIRALQLLANR